MHARLAYVFMRSRLALEKLDTPLDCRRQRETVHVRALRKRRDHTLRPRAARTLASSTCTRTRTYSTSSSVSSRIPIELWAMPSTDRTSTRLNTVLIKDIILDLPDLVGGGF